MRRVGVLALLAACSSQPSELRVTFPAGTKTVELMLARDCFGTDGIPCGPGVAWPSLVEQPPGHVYELDRDERMLYTVSGSELRIRTTPGQGNVDRLLLVAFGAGDMPIGITRVDDPPLTAPDQVIHVDIAPIDDVATDPQLPSSVSGAYRQHVWRGPNDPNEASCASTQAWDDNRHRWNREFYVPPHDHDCDQTEPLDCAPDWYDYSPQKPGSQSPYCTYTSTDLPPACVVGVQSCFDGSASTSCGNGGEIECLPDEMCEECPLLAPGCGAATIEAQVQRDFSRLTIASCTFTYDDTNGNQPCTSGGVDMQTLTLPKNCNGFQIYANAWPPIGSPPITSLVIGGATISVHLKQSAPCTLEFDFAGTAPTSLPTQRFILGVQNGTAEIEVPLSIRFSQSCQSNGNATCNFQGDGDNMWTCATL